MSCAHTDPAMKNFSKETKERLAAKIGRDFLAFSEKALAEGKSPAKLSDQLKGINGSCLVDSAAEELGLPELNKAAMAEVKKLAPLKALQSLKLQLEKFPLTVAHFSKK